VHAVQAGEAPRSPCATARAPPSRAGGTTR